MPELHIALCTDGVFPLATGGMQRHSRLLAEHLAAIEGVTITVFHPHPPGQFASSSGIREVHVPGIDVHRFYLRELWLYSARMAAALRTEMKKPGGPEVIFSQGFSIWKDIGRFSSRLMVHPHGLEMFQGLTTKERMLGWPFRRLVRHVARNSAAVVSLGGKLTPVLQRQVEGSRATVVVLPNAVEVPGHAPAYPEEDAPLRLLFVGRFAFNKGIDVLMQVARRLIAEKKPGTVQFMLAGGGPLLEHYKAAGLPENVQLLGRVDDEALERLYSECHGLVLPTRFEGMPTVVLEAMAHARPVLVSDVGASAELVETGRNGYLLPPGNAEAFYQAVQRFAAESQAQRRSMGLSGFRTAGQRFAWPVVAKQHVQAMLNLRERLHG
jgi:glycosyltransferase involved in cell wall biosynthesis